MKEITLVAEPKEGSGKGVARKVRAAGNIPAVLYGPEIKPQSLIVNRREFSIAMKAVAGTNAIFNVSVGGNTSKAIIRDLQRDPIDSHVLHIDFHAISLTKPMHISVPIRLDGIPVGVTTDGGIMQTNMRTLDISCLPSDLPDYISVDVSALNIGESIHVSDLDVPKATILSDEHRTVVVIAAPTVIKAADEEVAEGEEVLEGEEGVEGAVPAEGATPAEGEAAAPADDKKKK